MSAGRHPLTQAQKSNSGIPVATIGKPRILLAEDDKEMRRLLSWQLQHSGFDVIECSDGFELLDHLGAPALSRKPDDCDLIVSDIRMPGASGLEILEGIHECEWYLPVILITAFGSEQTHQLAEKHGAAAIFDKPFEIADLIARIREVLVLDSPKGSNWSRRGVMDEEDDMPIDIVFSHMPPSEFTESVVRLAATPLLQYRDKIIYCRVVIEGPRHPGMRKRYHIQVMVTLPDQVMVVRSNLRLITDQIGLHEAIPDAFAATVGKLRHYFDSRV
jgi:CheY-like chemotaxis protein